MVKENEHLPGSPVPPDAIVLTVMALALLNLVLAYLLARTVAPQVIELPDVVVWVTAGLGLLAGSAALSRWRSFVAAAREQKNHAVGDEDVRKMG